MQLTRYTIVSLLVVGAVYASAIRAEESKPATATTVDILVTLDGRPLESGRIFFHLPRDQFVGGKITVGKCKLDCVPPCTYVITIEGKDVPPKYAELKQAVLRLTVTAGDNGTGDNSIEINLASQN